MLKALLFLLAGNFYSLSHLQLPDRLVDQKVYKEASSGPEKRNHEIKALLMQHHLNADVVQKVALTLSCVPQYEKDNFNILTIIDYARPSNQKRLWVFDLYTMQLLYHTYVSHGLNSGYLFPTHFSNRYNSKESSLGVYKTEESYYGREGMSLRLTGLDPHFNDNASNRAIVMHPAWYMEEPFIKKYGRGGRSWGCPALPESLHKPIIETIRQQSLLVIYYPEDTWFQKSKFFNCHTKSYISSITAPQPPKEPTEPHDPVLYADLNKDNVKAERDPILVISADAYLTVFHKNPPLTRMLRRQIKEKEYIALSPDEVTHLASEQPSIIKEKTLFIIPELKMNRGYYQTIMTPVNLGELVTVKSEESSQNKFTLFFTNRGAVILKPTSQFIRWLGL